MNIFNPPKKNKFIIASSDLAGLGFAKILSEEGSDVFIACRMPDDIEDEQIESYDKVGEGIVEKFYLDDVWKDRKKYQSYNFIFDGNHNFKESEQLRREGFSVFGGRELTNKMEHDRTFGVSLIKKAGLATPDVFEFTDIQAGLDMLEQNEDKAYVFKPDKPDSKAWTTTVPDSEIDHEANEEMRKFLSSMGNGQGSYILQERKKGVEINVEVFMHKGKPYFAHANFECKKKYNKDLGRLIGCAMDINFPIPLESKIVQETLFNLIKIPEFQNFTGFLDLNLIVGDKKYWFLEFCARFGFNAHPNLFVNFALHPLGEIFNDMIIGNTGSFYEHFREGFGASITMRIDDPVMGLPIIVPQEVDKNFYYFDQYREDDCLYLSGYGEETGIAMGHDYDLKSAAEEALETAKKIHYPSRSFRSDIHLVDYLTNPQERYIAAQAMGLFAKI